MRSKKLKLIVGAMLVTMVGATFVGCGSSEGVNSDSNVASISISGSTSVGPLMEKVQDALTDAFYKDPIAVLTGIYTGDGERNWVFYTLSTNIFGRKLNEALQSFELLLHFSDSHFVFSLIIYLLFYRSMLYLPATNPHHPAVLLSAIEPPRVL